MGAREGIELEAGYLFRETNIVYIYGSGTCKASEYDTTHQPDSTNRTVMNGTQDIWTETRSHSS